MISNKKLYWILQILGWGAYTAIQLAFGLFSEALITTQGTVSLRAIMFLVAESILFFLITHYVRIFVKRRNWLNYDLKKLLVRVMFTSFGMGALLYFIRIPVLYSLSLFRLNITFDLAQFIGLTFIYSLIFFFWLLIYFAYHYFYRYNESLKYENLSKEIELNHLRAQINPHFFFNALNSIRALVDEDQQKSKNAINYLSGILRNSLSQDKKSFTKVKDEIKTVKAYLNLEVIRFEERLKVSYDISPDCNDMLIPPMMVQTIVENGVKHGIAQLIEGGVIELKTTLQNNYLVISVRNNGQLRASFEDLSTRGGIGIKNTIKRLRLLYGEKASFTIYNDDPTHVVSVIKIPFDNNNTLLTAQPQDEAKAS
jgi:two-component system, LytTR family, sensor kinase